MAFVEEGRLLAVCEVGEVMKGTRVRLHDPDSGRLVREFRFEGGEGGRLASSPDGALLAVQSFRLGKAVIVPRTGEAGLEVVPVVRLFDVATGRQLCSIPNCRDWQEGADFSGDGSRMAAASSDFAAVYDARSGRELFRLAGARRVAYNGPHLATLDSEAICASTTPTPGRSSGYSSGAQPPAPMLRLTTG